MIKQTYIYKKIGTCSIKADVYVPQQNPNTAAIIFIHGGALIGGNRIGSKPIIEHLIKAGYTVISIDYRLAPETKLREILEDLCDAFKWVRKEGPNLFHIDPNRIGVVGNSAGGYLTLMSGYLISPFPKVLVSFYGYGDIVGSWYTAPSPFYCAKGLVNEAEARRSVGSHMIAEVPQPSQRFLFYLYCRQQGIWPKEVTGYDPDTITKKFIEFCPIRNLTMQYPPTLFFHGDKDTDVPHEQSIAMADELKKHGVEHELIILPEKGHNFEEEEHQDAIVSSALNKMIAFIKTYL